MEETEEKKPIIDVTDKNLMRLTGEAWRALCEANEPPFLFRYGNLIVEIAKERNSPNSAVSVVTVDKLKHYMARMAHWMVQVKGGALINTFPLTTVIKDMMVINGMPLLPLDRVVSVPCFAPNGKLQTTPGYHADSKTYFMPADGLKVTEIASKPTRKDAIEAVAFLMDEVLQDFPFLDNSDIAHAIGYLLLFVTRDLIRGCTPLHLFEAACPGTGKSLLTEVLSFVGLGYFPEMMTEAKDEDEWRKRITAKLLTLPTLTILENIRSRLDSSHLAAALTMSYWGDRRLGFTENVRAPVRTIWAATGNNPALSAEMARRSIRIRLVAKSERPWLEKKEYRHKDIKGWIVENHGEVLSKLLIMVRAWIVAGRPLSSKKLGMYEEWAQVIGGILEFAGVPKFLENLEKFYEKSDSETQSLTLFIRSWKDKYSCSVGTAELFDLASEFLDLGYGNERSQRTCLGILLNQLRDRQIDGYYIVERGLRQGARQWQLEPVNNFNPGSGAI